MMYWSLIGLTIAQAVSAAWQNSTYREPRGEGEGEGVPGRGVEG